MGKTVLKSNLAVFLYRDLKWILKLLLIFYPLDRGF